VSDALGGLTFYYLLCTVPWPVIGAALGTWRRGRSPDAGLGSVSGTRA
jgi:hypothetical protein